MIFDKAVDAESGNITIKKSADDSVFATFDVTSDISGSGSTTITINPSSNLAYETEYYILIDATAFDDTYSNSYAGISATSTLNFTTEDTPDCPTVANAATYNSYPTCGPATCNDGYTLVNGACVANSGAVAVVPSPSVGVGQVDSFIPMYKEGNINEIKLNGTNILMYIGSTASFDKSVLGQDFIFKILDLNMITKKIKVEISPKQKIIELDVEGQKNIDLDNDGIDDIIFTYNELLVNRIDITIEQLKSGKKQIVDEVRQEEIIEQKIVFSNGQLYKEYNNPAVYLIENNKKRAFFNAEAFLSNNYKWENIIEVAKIDLPEGLMIYADAKYYNFANNLKPGDRGTEVMALQQFLNQAGFILVENGPGSPGNETEFFGNLTFSALTKFQQANNIEPADGFLGEATREIINLN